MGLDYKQFTQIAMIAQGDFQKLLIAGTAERGEIFRQIFIRKSIRRFRYVSGTKNGEEEKITMNCAGVSASI